LLITAFSLTFVLAILFNTAFSINPGIVNASSQTATGEEFLPSFEETRAEAVGEMVDLARYLGLPAGLLLLIAGSALWIYRRHPRRIQQQKKVHPLDPQKDGDILEEVRGMSVLAGLPQPPRLEISPGFRGQGGQAFGLPGRYVIRLDGGIRLLKRKAHASFRAILLHEIGHIANQDVNRTYLTQALWNALVVFIFIPLGLLMGVFFAQGVYTRFQDGFTLDDLVHVATVNVPALLLFCLRLGFIVYLVAFIRAGILRVREEYADWRAVAWGEEQGLLAVLKANAAAGTKTGMSSWLRLHPAAQERIKTVQDPARLFRLSLDLPFVTGILLAFLFSGVGIFGVVLLSGLLSLTKFGASLVAGYAQSLGDTLALPLAQIVVVGLYLSAFILALIPFALVAVQVYILYGVIGQQVQQEALAELSAGKAGWFPYVRLLLPSFLLALGVQVGMLVLPYSPFAPQDLPGFAHWLLWVPIATGLTWLCLAYARLLGERVLARDTSASPPRRKGTLLTLLLVGVFCVAYLPVFAAKFSFLDASSPSSGPFHIGVVTLVSLGLLGVAILVIGFVFALTLALVSLNARSRALRCPACRRKSAHSIAAGRVCESCGQDLAPWIYYRGDQAAV
jgi:Zn-dependent protease with chaperone function